jgi:hypothetical protein
MGEKLCDFCIAMQQKSDRGEEDFEKLVGKLNDATRSAGRLILTAWAEL